MKAILSIVFTSGFALFSFAGVAFRTIASERFAADPHQNAHSIIIKMPGDSTDAAYHGLKRTKAVYEFYQRRQGAICWISTNGLSRQGDSLITAIRNIRYFGLLPQDYHLNELEESLEGIDTNSLRTEALLTDALLLIAHDLKRGRSLVTSTPGPDESEVKVLEMVAGGNSPTLSLETLEPKQSGYTLLKAALRSSLDTLTGATRDEWMTGHTYGSIALHKTLQNIEINLERWRNSNTTTPGLEVVINIPSFTLDVVDRNTIILTSRVIVGAPKTPTPMLTSVIECIVVYPYWHVPRKIAVGDYLPLIQRDSTWLARHDFEILDRHGNTLNTDSIDWASYSEDYFPVIMRQREGPDNALGLLKFVFDNPHAVYLHDTNAKTLFKDSYRAYSHGCVRVQNAEGLAHYLVTGDLNTRSQELDSAMQQQLRRSIGLLQPVPVEIRYFTCEVRDGKFCRYHDIYRLDEELVSTLYK